MGLPDGYKPRGSYREVAIRNAGGFIGDLLENTILEYTGYGEIISAKFEVYNATVNLHYNDNLRFYIDGTEVLNELLIDILRRRYDVGQSIMIPTRFIQMVDFTFNLRVGLFFNEEIRITYQKVLAGNLSFVSNTSFGLY